MKRLFSKASTAFTADPRAEVEKIRSRIETLAEERSRVEALPRPPQEAMAQFEAFLDAAEDRADLMDFAGKFRWGTAQAWPTTVERAPGVMLLAIMAMCFRDTMVEKFGAMIRDAYDGKQSASREEQNELLANIDREAEALCRQEEALIRAAEAGGILIARRSDAPPAAVLAPDVDLT